MKKPKAPGRNIAESERNTVRISLRLSPEVAEDLRAYAERRNVTLGCAVGLLLEARSDAVE